MRHITQAGLDLIARWEGCRLDAYQDVVGVWTIGYGHTPAVPGAQIDEAEALSLLRNDVALAEQAIDAATSVVQTTDDQFSAMVSLTFNIGAGAFRSSSVLRNHTLARHVEAAASFLLWDKVHVDGELQVVPGLLKRREQERDLYISGSSYVTPIIPTAKDLQAALAALGLYTGQTDGLWGPLSQMALTAYYLRPTT